MVYFRSDELVVRDMEKADAQIFTDQFAAQGWHPDVGVYLDRIKDCAEGKCVALTAVFRGQPAGHVYVYRTAHGGPFAGKNWPIIVDFSVLEKYRGNGIGSKLMDVAEQVAGRYADTVCLGVGLSREYGSAQRMYVKRGYIPDGSGVWYNDMQCEQYKTVCTVDDDLVLYFYKKLSV